MAFSTFKSSVFLLGNFDKECLSDDETKLFMDHMIYFYNQIYDNIESLAIFSRGINNSKNYYALGSFMLIKNILFRWMDEVRRRYIVDTSEDIDDFYCIQLYSINVNDDVLEEEMANTIKNIINKELYKNFESHDSELYALPKNAEDFKPHAKYHIFKASNNKKCIVKVLDLVNNNISPSGVSTAYLNYKSGFKSLGYIGFSMISDSKFDYMLISIEEESDFYFSVMEGQQASAKQLDKLMGNNFEISYFLLDFLDLLKSLFMFKIKLRSRLIFGVDSSDNKRWRFRLDDIGYFSYSKNASLFDNYKYLAAIIDEVILLVSTLKSVEFFKEFKRVEEELRNTVNQDYFIILSKLIECNMKDI